MLPATGSQRLYGQNAAADRRPQVTAAARTPTRPAAAPAAPGQAAPGGAASADFDSLIDLITSTVQADSWLENGTGEGEIQPFAINGVYVDAAGAVRLRPGASRSASLAAIRQAGAAGKTADPGDARVPSDLRYVSLVRLEAAIAARLARQGPLDPEMLTLAGLQRIRYILVYPDNRDLVLAGPAGDWTAIAGGGLVSAGAGRPIVRLDDLLALWRRQRSQRASAFGCSIVPRQAALAQVQDYLAASSARPIDAGARREWLEGLRRALGVQDVEYYNVDPASRIANLLFFADYHMKLIGMGLAEGVPGVSSYLAAVRVGPDGRPPAMSVLRWWFSMPQLVVDATAERDAFAVPQRCIEVLSENEMLAARGQRVHTGQSDDDNRRFAESFTKNFAAIADKYPFYGELERVFELALAISIIERQQLAEMAGWSPSLFLDDARLALPKGRAPRTVETVINHRVIGGRHVIAGVSGGVWLDGGTSAKVIGATGDAAAKLAAIKASPRTPLALPSNGHEHDMAWWWD
ncbi:MAG: hypothetical protein DCC67_00265 [Planctomycetota bacterium]|nr:MAG: hypothetical protein DCC67_00265 [Planctomycetota bacterium]